MSAGAVAAVLTVGGSLVLCAAVAWIVVARIRGENYAGVIADKSLNTDDDGTSSYRLILSLDDGRAKSVTVDKALWSSLAVGDKVVKRPGRFSPERA
ncbi:MAG: hypothetical protein KGO02_01220 [Alphaproteobacteria bacterium]|nr:hypothetical protein [Alphaproteobacteria bacterium]